MKQLVNYIKLTIRKRTLSFFLVLCGEILLEQQREVRN